MPRAWGKLQERLAVIDGEVEGSLPRMGISSLVLFGSSGVAEALKLFTSVGGVTSIS